MTKESTVGGLYPLLFPNQSKGPAMSGLGYNQADEAFPYMDYG